MDTSQMDVAEATRWSREVALNDLLAIRRELSDLRTARRLVKSNFTGEALRLALTYVAAHAARNDGRWTVTRRLVNKIRQVEKLHGLKPKR